MDKLAVLSQYFGYSSFRQGQEQIVNAILSGQDTLAVMPTGAGKSLCFQVPGLMLPGITLVISPLISLMRDQVAALVAAGIPGAFLNSSLTEAQYSKALSLAMQGRYKIIYVAPERLSTERFMRFAQSVSIAQVAVDEAHCVSQWGQDFRPSYLTIPEFVDSLPMRPVVSAFTATATRQVREDVAQLLRLREPFTLITGFDRPNLFFDVWQTKDKPRLLQAVLEQHRGHAGIVYCSTRKTVEEVQAMLAEKGFPATRYHAGLEDRERTANQEDFLYDRKPIMVATNAFGMGIDKSDVRFVVHYQMPGDLEGYYQEAGRAGRDGEPSDCVLLFSEQDVMLRRYLIEHTGDTVEGIDPETQKLLRERDYGRLRVMTQYCRLHRCFRAFILQYFGEEARPCGCCGNCRRMGDTEDITQDALAILRCVQYFHGRFGRSTYVALLCGGKSKTVERLELHYPEERGLLPHRSPAFLRAVCDWLCEIGVLRQGTGEFPTLELGDEADGILSGDPVLMPAAGLRGKPGEKSEGRRRKSPRPGRASSLPPDDFADSFRDPEDPGQTVSDLYLMEPSGYRPPSVLSASKSALRGEAAELFEHLRAVRLEMAREKGVPAFVILSDATLRGIAEAAPASSQELLAVNGIGPAKLEQFGERILLEIRQFRAGSHP